MASLMYVRAQDPFTGHEFDVLEKDPRLGKTLKRVKEDRYPASPLPRPTKYRVLSAPRTDSPEVTEEPGSAPGEGVIQEPRSSENASGRPARRQQPAPSGGATVINKEN